MNKKRAIIVLSEDDHLDFKTYCTSVGSNIQETCISAINEYLSKRKVPIELSTPTIKEGE